MNENGKHKVTGKSVAKYVLTPGITPELRRLARSLGHFAHLIALVFARAGIFKTNHPYVNPANIGRFGLGDVFGAAAQSFKFDRKHFPQAAIYLATISLVVLMSAQVALTVVSIGVGEARAAAPVFTCTAPCDPVNDLALNFLGDIFGEYDFITEGNAAGRTPTSVHQGLWTLLAYYSNALLIVATFIVLYYVVSAVGETAVYGTPFGRRFNSVWAPLRLVTAIGLLVPLPMALNAGNPGLNSGQYIVLFAAKSGSNLASNALSIFTTAVSQGSYAQGFVSQPGMPQIGSVVQGTWTWALCNAAVHKAAVSETIDLVDSQTLLGSDAFDKASPNYLNFWVKSPVASEEWRRASTIGGVDGNFVPGNAVASAPIPPTGTAIVDYYMNKFGNDDEGQFPPGSEPGTGDLLLAMGPPGKPDYCGTIALPENMLADMNTAKSMTQDPTSAAVANKFEFANKIRKAYMNLPRQFFTGANPAPHMLDTGDDIACMMMSQGCVPATFGDPTLMPSKNVPANWVTWARNQIIPLLSNVADRQNYAIANAIDMNNGYVASRGWAVSALYFNEIMRANLILEKAAGSVPAMVDAPVPLEHYQQENPSLAEGVVSGSGMQGANGIDYLQPGSMELGKGAGNPNITIKQATSDTSVQENSTNVEASFDFELGQVIGAGLWWYNAAPTPENQAQSGGDSGDSTCTLEKPTWKGCAMWLVGLKGFHDLVNTDPRRQNPLVVMQSTGNQLVNRAGFLTVIAAGAGILSPAAGNALFAFAGMGFGVGAFLAYVLPLMPFLYFFFGVVQWGFSVFEAVVAAPLWALSHLRIDGEGLPGPAAMNGYYLIFEIFLRPILLLFGLIAAAVCFTAAAWMLHQTWQAATDPLGGNIFTDAVASIVMMILYTFVTYMLANSCFRLITMIPQGILRWMGQGGATPLSDMFGDISGQLQTGGMGAAGVTGGAISKAGQGGAAGGNYLKRRIQNRKKGGAS